ncbi:MAG: hypothetical protein AAGH41_06730 [Pseudomonadota bacterium]
MRKDKTPPADLLPLLMEWRAPRFGKSNPENLTNDAWVWIIQNHVVAYHVDVALSLLDRRVRKPVWYIQEQGKTLEPMDWPAWCFDRMINTRTELPDGRTISIGGCHEDWYDSDFYIYNDVVVQSPDGTVQIFGYPEDIFPPTDHHSATLADNRIIIIGNGAIGAPEEDLPVYALSLSDFSMEKIVCDGEVPVGLIDQSACYDAGAHRVLVEGGEMSHPEWGNTDNIDLWSLDLSSRTWTRETRRPWSRFVIFREPWSRNRLSDFYDVLRAQRTGRWSKWDQEKLDRLTDGGCELDEQLFNARYTPPIEHTVIESKDGFRAAHRIEIAGTQVFYRQDDDGVYLTIEGSLGSDVTQALIDDLLGKLSRLENKPYAYKSIDV